MVLTHDTPATAFRSWDHDTTRLDSRPTEPSNLNDGESSQGADSWIGVDEERVKTPESGNSTPVSASSESQESISRHFLQYNTPIVDSALSGTTIANVSYSSDAATSSSHAVHLLPSEPNGTWRSQVSYAMTSSSEIAPTLREVFKEYLFQLDLGMLMEKAKGHRDDLKVWLNQSFANQDLDEIHDRVRRSMSIPSMPNMRQIDWAVDAVSEIAQSLRKRYSESELLEKLRDDKYIFAEVVCRKAQHALVEQGICKKWQLQCENDVRLQHGMQTALLQTFTRIQQAYMNVPLFRARPRWIAQRESKAWRLELDVGVVGVEVGPVTDRSLIELGCIDTGFELPESRGSAPITDTDRQTQSVEDGWQLLEA
jgi:hypothetical protein